MGGRDHSCEVCGRGGFNDPDGVCVCTQRSHSDAVRRADEERRRRYAEWDRRTAIDEGYEREHNEPATSRNEAAS